MRFRRALPTIVITLLLAASGFGAAALASSEGFASAVQTGTTTLVTTVVSPPSTVTQTVTVTRRFPLVTLCHHRATNRGPGGRHVTIRVTSNQSRAHRQHGDTVGRCTTARNRRIHRSSAHARRFH
jgi:hypothetical protein